jgi:site-specific DNA-cytosine methylase
MRVLVACEESQRVTAELRKRGHKAYSCDLLATSGNNPEWHLQEDVFKVLNEGWDMMIAFPPCTHLAASGARWFKEKRRDGRQQQGIDFFMQIIKAPIDKIAVENPVGIMSTHYRKPDQIIQPWQFGDAAQKSTCLWLKNLPQLVPTKIVSPGEFYHFKCRKTGKAKKQPLWYYEALQKAKTPAERSTLRSKTFEGIAQAMATQWT